MRVIKTQTPVYQYAPERNRITIITTGGTIEKTYDEKRGALANNGSILNKMLKRLRLPGLQISQQHLTVKDSLDLTELERKIIVKTILKTARQTPVVALHGTDTLALTGQMLCAHGPKKSIFPIVLTGAMCPFVIRNSDALQNLTEAIAAARLARGGYYAAFHGRLFELPHIVKNRQRRTFVRQQMRLPRRPKLI